MKTASPETREKMTEELEDWQSELARIQALQPVEASRDKLQNEEIPQIEAQIKNQDEDLPHLVRKAEEVRSCLPLLQHANQHAWFRRKAPLIT
jgi:hypothetical protein